jgi:hypothetical protein
MKSTILIAIALASTGLCSPTNGADALQKRWGFCGTSSFENQGSEASPRVTDCEQLSRNIAGDGSWHITSAGWRTLATYGSCAFGAQAREAYVVNVGNEDIRDLIRDSINMFRRHDGKVGSKGMMECEQVGGFPIKVDWGIYRT